MTVYSAISKKIGWEGKATLPSISEALELERMVKSGDAYAFEKVFYIHRFIPHTAIATVADIEIMKVVRNAFTVGSEIFKAKEAKI